MAKILIVEDDEYFREALSACLIQHQHDVVSAADGSLAREILQTTNVDLILSDYYLPRLNGLDLLKWVRANRPVRFVLMSAISDLETMKFAYAHGVSAFLAKPFRNAQLLSLVADLTSSKSPTKSMTSPGDGLVAQEPTAVAPVNEYQYKILVVDDDDDFVKILEQVIQQLGCAVEVASSAEQALQKVNANHYDLVITDMVMPGMDGKQLLEHIEQMEGHRPYVVVMTGYSTYSESLLDEVGASGFLPKPFATNNLREILQFYLPLVQQRQDREQK